MPLLDLKDKKSYQLQTEEGKDEITLQKISTSTTGIILRKNH
jgi:hypothetical protein